MWHNLFCVLYYKIRRGIDSVAERNLAEGCNMENDNKNEEIKKDKCADKEGRLSRWLCYFVSAFGKYPIGDDVCFGVHCY